MRYYGLNHVTEVAKEFHLQGTVRPSVLVALR